MENEKLLLSCIFVEGRIEIKIGAPVLKSFAECDPHYMNEQGKSTIQITNSTIFAKEVVEEIIREDELGNSLLTEFIDKAIFMAYENGCLGLEDNR